MLKTFTLPGTDTVMPGQADTEWLVKLSHHNDFAKEAAIKSLTRCWHIANNRSQLAPHRRLYTKALKALAAEIPGKVNLIAGPISREDFEACTGTVPEEGV